MKKKIILTGGGTGGHIIPLLVIADDLKNDADIMFIGSSGMESKIVPKELNFKKIFAGKIRRYITFGSILLNIIDIFKTIIGFLQSLIFILYFKPDVIFAKGGYVAFPVVFAAALLRKKIYIHESDMVAGMANKFCAKFASKIFVGFPIENYPFDKKKMIFAGIPVRHEFSSARSEEDYKFFDFSKQEKVLLITGGSQGARCFNEFAIDNLEKIIEKAQVIMLSGDAYYERFEKIKETLKQKNKLRVYKFLPEMDKAIRISDLVLSRASATTIFEIAAAAKPAVLIPLSSAASNHQEANALYAQSLGIAKKYSEQELKSEEFLKAIFELLENSCELEKMSAKTKKISELNSLQIIREEILK